MRLRSALALWAFVAALVLVASTSVVQAAAVVKSVDVLRYTAPDGETYFALPLLAPANAKETSSSRDVVILVDTSASQTGSHRVRPWPFSKMSSRRWAVRTVSACLPLTYRRPL